MHAVIVGGGIVGLASAYALADEGATVTVCEKGSIGSGSTERSVGGIRAQFSTPVNVDLSLESMRVWETFEDRFGIDIEYRRTGYLFLARTEAMADTFRENVAMQTDRGVPSTFLEPEEALEYCSGIRPEAFVGATYSPTDGFADPHLAVQGYAQAATEAGATVLTKTAVTDVRQDGGQVTGVETETGRLEADVVVNAAGPWARQVAAMADVSLPIAPRRRQLAVVEPETSVPESDPLAIDMARGSYFRPERDGDALVGGHFADVDPDHDPDAYSTSFDFDWAASALEAAADWTTYFGPESGIKRGWAGLYAVTPDNHPIVEETAPGLITAAGFSGHGFQHAPATGRLVAELALDGEASLVDIDGLSSDRFVADERHVEQNVV
ncbi:NAD(P)/FAD-dependent oxidoreductase [Natronobeatus ordinarius]|uniref:NAD(P)/FAD-dependent oxidoreductase n=1 Tax=Natronobeatus ordinarius TaxID=2963433 RepID=UPI0020CD1A57|nr:FAD-dependent oxidoreductase [Natronobeatus ordinarius]